MDISEETQKIGSNPIIRYGILFIGLAVLFLSQGILTWKRTAVQDARGDVDKIQFNIGKLQKEVADTKDAGEKKSLGEEIKELKENDLVEAQMEAASEEVDSNNGMWLWSMASLKGIAIVAVGLLVIAATGGSHEKIGALVALGLIVARM
ncbi:MAG: hypothetical protein AB8F34_01465 [Akkermansiaceae bacterium]